MAGDGLAHGSLKQWRVKCEAPGDLASLPTLQSPVTQISLHYRDGTTSGVDTDRDNVDTDVVMRL